MRHINKTYRDKAKRQIHKKTTSYAEQILEVTPNETTAIQPLTTHLKNHWSQLNKTYEALLEKQGRSPKDSYTQTC